MCSAKLASLLAKDQLYFPGCLNWLPASPLSTAILSSFKFLYDGSVTRWETSKKQHSSEPDRAASFRAGSKTHKSRLVPLPHTPLRQSKVKTSSGLVQETWKLVAQPTSNETQHYLHCTRAALRL